MRPIETAAASGWPTLRELRPGSPTRRRQSTEPQSKKILAFDCSSAAFCSVTVHLDVLKQTGPPDIFGVCTVRL